MTDERDDELADEPFALKPEKSKQAKGGDARARSLTPSERSEIARSAAAAKHNFPRALKEAILEVGPLKFPCAVLEGDIAVISESAWMEQMGIYRSGALSTRRRPEGGDAGARGALHLAFKNLAPFIRKHFGGTTGPKPIKYRSLKGPVGHGVRADVLSKVCEVWIDADRADTFRDAPTQKKIAGFADILLRAFAAVGAVALVYEANGHIADRQRKELQELLKEYLSDKLREYVPTFPDRYFKEMCRLRGVQWRPDMKLPRYFGHLTRDIVYRRLAPNVLASLEAMAPTDESGRRKAKLFQGLSEDFGLTQLKQHHGVILGLMALSDDGDWDGFKALLDRVAPVHQDLPLLDAAYPPDVPSPQRRPRKPPEGRS